MHLCLGRSGLLWTCMADNIKADTPVATGRLVSSIAHGSMLDPILCPTSRYRENSELVALDEGTVRLGRWHYEKVLPKHQQSACSSVSESRSGQLLPGPHAAEHSLSMIISPNEDYVHLILDVLPVQVYSAALDGHLKRWNLEDGSCLHSILIGKPIHSMVCQSASTHLSATPTANFLRHATGKIFPVWWLLLLVVVCWFEPHYSGCVAGGKHVPRL